MRQRVKGRKLNRTSSHRRAMFRNMLTSLFEHKRIHTTEAKAKELRPIAERVITRAIKAVRRETQGLLSEGAKHDLNTRRLIGSYLMKKSVVDILFDEIVPEVGERQGGYTRVVKTGIRRGDAGRTALIELVDYNTEIDETARPNKKKKVKSASANPVAKAGTEKEEITDTAENNNEEEVSEVETATEETPVQESETKEDSAATPKTDDDSENTKNEKSE